MCGSACLLQVATLLLPGVPTLYKPITTKTRINLLNSLVVVAGAVTEQNGTKHGNT